MYQLVVSPGVVPMMMSVDNSCEIDLPRFNKIFQDWCDSVMSLVLLYSSDIRGILTHPGWLDR